MKSLLWKSVSIHIEIRTNYSNKNFALRLALKERLRGTRKWSIAKTRIGHVFLVIASVLMLLESTENERNDRTQLDDFFSFRMGVIYNAHPKGKYLLVTPCLQVLFKEILEGERNFLLTITWANVYSVISASPHKRRGHRSRSRSPYRRRSRSRSRSRSPHRRRHRSKSRSKSPEKSSKKSKKSDKPDKKKESESTGMSKDELEVKEANELRAKLGLKPLKP